MDLDWASIVRIVLFTLAFFGTALWLHESRKRYRRRNQREKK